MTNRHHCIEASRHALEAMAASLTENVQDSDARSTLHEMLDDARRLLEPCLKALEEERLFGASRHLDGAAFDVAALGLGEFVEALTDRISRKAASTEHAALVRGWAMRAKGYARFADGDFAGARRRFRRALRWATEADDPTLQGASLLSIGVVFYQQGNEIRARGAYEQALPYARRADEPWLLAYLSTNLGSLIMTEDAERADELFAESLRVREFMRASEDALEPILSPVYINWGALRAQQGRYSKAEELFRKALSASGDLDPQGRALASQSLGKVLTEQRRYTEAVAAYEDALTLAQHYGDRGKEGELRRALAVCLDQAGDFRRAYELFLEVAEAADMYWLNDFDAAMAVHDSGVMAVKLGSFELGAAQFQTARNLFAEMNDKKWVATCLLDEAAAYATLGREEQQETLLREALAVAKGTRHHDVKLTTYRRLTHLLFERTLAEDAVTVFRRERQLLQRLGKVGELAGRTAEVGVALAHINQTLGAVEMFRKAALLYESLEDIAAWLGVRNDLANALVELGSIEDAEQLYRENLERARVLENRALQADALLNLGELLRRKEDIEGATRTLEKALELSRQLNDFSRIALGTNNLGLVFKGAGKPELAMRAFEDSLEVATLAQDEGAVARSLGSMGSAAFTNADFAESRQLYERAVEHAFRSGEQSLEAEMTFNLACAVYELQGASQAESYIDSAVEQAQDVLDFALCYRAAKAIATWFVRDQDPLNGGDWTAYALMFGPLLSGRLDILADQVAEPLSLMVEQDRRRFLAAMLNRCRLIKHETDFGGALIKEAQALRGTLS